MKEGCLLLPRASSQQGPYALMAMEKYQHPSARQQHDRSSILTLKQPHQDRNISQGHTRTKQSTLTAASAQHNHHNKFQSHFNF